MDSLLDVMGKSKLALLYKRLKKKFNITADEEGIVILLYILIVPIASSFLLSDLGITIGILSYLIVLTIPIFLILLIRGLHFIKVNIKLEKTSEVNFNNNEQKIPSRGSAFFTISLFALFAILGLIKSNSGWDILIIALTVLIISYGSFVGSSKIIKIIVATYVAILASDGIGGLVSRFFINENLLMNYANLPDNQNKLIFIKLFIFIFTIVLISQRGNFEIKIKKSESLIMSSILNLTYGLLSVGLIISTILIYASGASITQATGVTMNESVLAIYRESQFVRLMINNYNAWFSLPAIAFIFSSLFRDK
jgi:hypothetical protein